MFYIFLLPYFMYTHKCKYWDPDI